MKKSTELPSWYPLPIYNRELSDEEWAVEIMLRASFQSIVARREEGNQELSTLRFESGASVTDVFDSLFVNTDRDVDRWFEKEKWPISEMTTFEAHMIAALCRPVTPSVERVWASRLSRNPRKWMAEFFVSDISKTMRQESSSYLREHIDHPDLQQWHADILGHRVPLMVNVNLDDETLKQWFEVWLAGIRAGTAPSEQAFTSKDTAIWKKFGLLPAFDLMIWGRITGAPFTDVSIAKIIFPDSEVNIFDLYRKKTKPLVKSVITLWEAQRLLDQVSLVRQVTKVAREMGKLPPGEKITL